MAIRLIGTTRPGSHSKPGIRFPQNNIQKEHHELDTHSHDMEQEKTPYPLNHMLQGQTHMGTSMGMGTDQYTPTPISLAKNMG